MRIAKEIEQHVTTEVRMLMAKEPDEIRHFYTYLSVPNTKLSMELMATLASREWSVFSPVVANGETIAYTKPGLILTPSQSPWLFMPDSPSAGGKTTLVRSLVRECKDCTRIIKTCTTQNPRPEERRTAKKERISNNPPVDAIVTDQYWHISRDQFMRLSSSGFFIESRPMWREALYGIPRAPMEQAEFSATPFLFLVVDENGQQVASQWLQDHRSHLGVQKWFLLPTNQTFADLANRITFLRTEQAAPRIIDAVRDLWYGASRTDVIFPYPFDLSGVPHKAISNSKQYMNMLRPGFLR